MKRAMKLSLEKKEEKQLTYNDVQNTIETDYTTKMREQITKTIQDELQKKYPVKIFKDVLKQNLAALGIPVQE